MYVRNGGGISKEKEEEAERMAAFLKFKEDEQKREQERQSAIHRNPNEVKVD